MCFILSIETSTNVCSVAIHNKGKLLSCEESTAPNSHSEILNNFIDKALNKANIKFKDLDAICISKGPGSYTGLRIGLSTAKGLCYALDIPLISIDTLYGLYLTTLESNTKDVKYYIPMIDARRMEVYAAVFDKNGNINVNTHAEILHKDSFSETISDGLTLLFGSGSRKFRYLISAHNNTFFLNNIIPSSKNFGKYAFEKYLKGKFENVSYFEPYYLKEFHTILSKKISLTNNG